MKADPVLEMRIFDDLPAEMRGLLNEALESYPPSMAKAYLDVMTLDDAVRIIGEHDAKQSAR